MFVLVASVNDHDYNTELYSQSQSEAEMMALSYLGLHPEVEAVRCQYHDTAVDTVVEVKTYFNEN